MSKREQEDTKVGSKRAQKGKGRQRTKEEERESGKAKLVEKIWKNTFLC